MNSIKKYLVALSLLIPSLSNADTPPQVINKTCSANQYLNKIAPGAGNITCAQPSYSGLTGLPSFIDSLVQISTNVMLVNDNNTPGNSQYYGTNSSGTKGFYALSGAPVAWGSITGTLSNQTDLQTALNAKQNTLTEGNLTEVTSSVLTITGGTNAVIGSGTSILVKQSNTTTSGYLSNTDWNTFNGKQAAGNYITALTTDVVAAGPGSVAATIQANVVSNSKLAQMNANTIKGNNTGSAANALDLSVGQVQTMLGTSGTNTGDVTLAAVGSTPSANGASLVGQVLTLQPVDATHPGLVTTGTQTFAGSKTFSSAPAFSSIVNTGTLTLPTSNDTLLGRATTDTLTNKSISGGTNTFSSIPNSATTATNANTLSAIVARDGSGNFSAGTITASLTGHSSLDLALTGGTISGNIAFSTSGDGLTGTATNDSASAGIVGEYITSFQAATVAPTTTQYGDLTSISLTAGDWDVSISGEALQAGATVTNMTVGVSTTTGNSSAGLVSGDNLITVPTPTSLASSGFALPLVRESLNGNTTIYFKINATYSVGTPQFRGRISARRRR